MTVHDRGNLGAGDLPRGRGPDPVALYTAAGVIAECLLGNAGLRIGGGKCEHVLVTASVGGSGG